MSEYRLNGRSYLDQKQVLGRGILDKLAVAKLLGEPDTTRPNPRAKTRPIKLFEVARVEQAEATCRTLEAEVAAEMEAEVAGELEAEVATEVGVEVAVEMQQERNLA